MRRFRITFLVVAVVLLAAVGLLVLGALEALDLERRIRHEALAERVFDEMERSLSQFIAAEEARGFADYVSAGAPDGAARSPFVIGRFEIDPSGAVRLPRTAGGDAGGATRDLAEGVAEWRRQRPELGQGIRLAQQPGSTVQLDDENALGDNETEKAQAARKEQEGASVYAALRSLNKGVEQRSERQTKVLRSVMPSEVGDGDSTAAAMRPIELSPLAGSRVGARHFVLARNAVQGGRIHRQGVMLDVAALVAWLGEQAIGSTELADRARLDFGAEGSSVEWGELLFQHRFAAPFESLSARLVLVPLPGLGGGTYVYALSALSFAAVVLGLCALYRMTSVVLRYAEQRENFVAAVTHELKTPLAAIRLYGEMLRDGIVPSEEKRDEYHRHITAESERLSRLINNVLEHSHLERGSRRLTIEAGDLGAAVRDAATLVRPHVEGAGFALDLRLDADLPPVRFERDAVMQILFNLVDNAVKYAADATAKRIELCCRQDGGAVRLAVRDGGPGVPPSHLGRIFEPFQRAESELTRRTKGTGLGLALVRGLAEAMQARVTGRNLSAGGFEVELEFRRA